MSRKRMPAPPAKHGIVNLLCPDGHTVGRIMAKDTGRLAVIDGQFASRDHRRQPLSVRCLSCEADGLRRDLRGSWQKAFRLAEEVRTDPTRGTEDYQLGG